MQPEMNIVTTIDHDRVAINEEIEDAESMYTWVIMGSIIVLIVVLVL